jgi:hypothetical protein
MKPKTLARLEEEFRSFPVMSSGPPAESAWKMELARLDFSPPEDYVEFIRRFGGSIVGSYSIIGVGASSAMGSEEESVADFTAMFRADGWPGSDDWIVFSKDLAGNPIGLDKNGAVWTWDHDSREIVKLADSFELFLVEHCLEE